MKTRNELNAVARRWAAQDFSRAEWAEANAIEQPLAADFWREYASRLRCVARTYALRIAGVAKAEVQS